jgi:hypothetical protein
VKRTGGSARLEPAPALRPGLSDSSAKEFLVLAGSRLVGVALCSLLAVAVAPSAAVADGRVRATGVSDSVNDPRGDVKNDDGAAVTQPEADVVTAGAEDRGNDIVFTLLVDRPTDPQTTKNWEGGTAAAWGVDTNGDNTPEYLVAFGRGENGQLAVQVARVDNQPGAAAPCGGTGSLGPKGEFVATVPAGCLGDPASFRYAAAMSWDTDPANGNAPAVGDSAPDGDNLAGPVAKP